MIPVWKIEMARYYYKGDWDSAAIARKLNITHKEVWECIEGKATGDYPVRVGGKDAAYYEDEMDYTTLGPCPLPNHLFLS